MSRYYALTITQVSGKKCEYNYNKSLDRYQKKYSVTIFPRYFETAPKSGLHVHCLVSQDLDDPEIKTFIGQKNHNIDFELCQTKAAWLNYIRKDQQINLIKRKEGAFAPGISVEIPVLLSKNICSDFDLKNRLKKYNLFTKKLIEVN